MISHAELELLKALLFCTLAAYLWRLSRKEHLRGGAPIWKFFYGGFAFILLAFFVSMTEDFPFFEKYIFLGKTPYESFLKNGVLFPLGFVGVAIGIGKLLPFVDRLKKAETALTEAVDTLEAKVRKRTADLVEANEHLSREIVEREKAQESLRQHSYFLETLMDSIPTPVFFKDNRGTYLGCNRAFEEWVHLPKEEIIGQSVDDILNKELADEHHEKDQELFTHPGALLYEASSFHSDGSVRSAIFNKATFLNAEGTVGGLIGVISDITDRKEAEEAVRKARDELERTVETRTDELRRTNTELQRQVEERERAEERYRTLVELAPVAIHINTDGTVVFANSAAAQAMGVRNTQELVGRSVHEFLDPGLREMAKLRTDWMLQEWKPAPMVEMSGVRVDGSHAWVQIHSAPIMYDGKPSIMVFALDTTESKLAEDKVRNSLREKEVLLREIHHRVKNNLQLIASMLELQAQSIGDIKIIEKIKGAQNRVWAMAAAHETLYQSGNLAEISSRNYLSRLLMHLVSTMHSETAQVELIEDLEDVPMKIDAAINCGLVLSELIANCYKHAFLNIADGAIEVSLKAVEENRIELAVRDNGVGLPEGTDIRNLKSFGLNLVAMLVQELKGEMCVKSDGGTEFSITFPSVGT